MNNTGSYAKIKENLTFLKSKESLAVIDDTINYVSKNNLSFIDGFLYFTEQQVEKKKINLVNHSVKMAGFPKIKSLAEFDFDYQPSINKEQINIKSWHKIFKLVVIKHIFYYICNNVFIKILVIIMYHHLNKQKLQNVNLLIL